LIGSTDLASLENALASRSRMALGHFPTPLEEAPRLSARLGATIWIKRDDLTGLALGGNKVRKLEFLIADALERGADTIVTTGGSQSNHARLTAAACRLANLRCHLVLDRGVHPDPQGNLLLDSLLGAHVHLIESSDPMVAVSEMESLAEELRDQGHSPVVVPRGGSVPAGATGYAAFVAELLAQTEEKALQPSHLYLGTGSTGTHSGILAGLAAAGSSLSVQGVSVSRTKTEQVEKIFKLANQTLEYLGIDESVSEDRIRVDDRFRGPGYGLPTTETMEAISLAALDEGLILDPVYTGKAMAGLIGHARERRFSADDTVIFLHTGGSPALFAYHEEVVVGLQASMA
jgi:D-cysteine desulfhydrase family pyridoxal phosphate-dependent enzyme